MFDELNNDTQPQQEQVVEQSQETTQESKRDRNTQNLRERAEAAERRAAEYERYIQQNMNQQQTTKIQIEDEDDLGISDDTYVEGKHLKKYIKKLEKKLENNEKRFSEYNETNAEMRLKGQFSDFDSVVNNDNLRKLQQQKPALYRTILSNPDLYDKGYTAYELIKNSGIATNNNNDNNYEDIDRRVAQNQSKPRSASNVAPQVSESPLGEVSNIGRRILSEKQAADIIRQSSQYADQFQQ